MIPYFPQPEFHLFGPVTVHAFGAFVALSVIVGWRMAVAHDHPGRITNSPPTWPGGNGKVNPPGNIGHRRG